MIRNAAAKNIAAAKTGRYERFNHNFSV